VRVVLQVRDFIRLAKCPQSVGALSTFYLAMSLFPEVQRKAQNEIDRVIGGGRLPNLYDRGQLPYVSALLDEVHRWRPVVSLGLSLKNRV
jgi:cytochrome P450